MSWRIPPNWRASLAAAPASSVRTGSIGARLDALLERVVPGAPLADVCADHARLAVAAVRDGIVPRATAADIAAAPVSLATKAVMHAGLEDRVEVRMGDGLAPIDDVAGGTVVIAGVGGQLAARILDAGSLRRVGALRVVVQPNSDAWAVRDRFFDLGWRIVDEALVVESGRLFLVIVAEPSGGTSIDNEHGPLAQPDAVDRYVGPVLRIRSTSALRVWLDVQQAWLAPRVEALERVCDPAVDEARVRLRAIQSVAARFG